MKGVIIKRGENYYTDLQKLFIAIGNIQNDYNWLITNCECYPQKKEYEELFSHEYCWLSGEELTEIVENDNFQWIWVVLTGFKKDIYLEQVLSYNLPKAEGYEGFWKNPVSIQHPLADLEIVSWDGSLTLFISKKQELAKKVQKTYYLSQDLHHYNAN